MTNTSGLSHATHRFLDGDAATPTPPELRVAEQLQAAAAAYLAGLGAPDESGRRDDAIMAAVRTAGRRPAGVLGWLVAPQPLRVRPIVLALAASLVLFVWMQQPRPTPVTAPGPAVAPGMVLVRFELLAPDAQSVALAGAFNRWSPEAIPLVPSTTPGLWTVTLPLPLGSHEYLFVVDGRRWIADPGAHAQVDDGYGQTNSVIVVGPRGVVKS